LENEQLDFTVTDTGIGLSEEHLAQMFEIFTQADNSISRRFSGSGLGLFLSEQLANVMSGDITVTSELNHGSTFVLKLPFGEVYHALDKVENSENMDGIMTNKKQYIGKILLAEDHDDNRRLIARLLTSIGLEVIEAANGIEAVESCIEHKPQLVLLDIQMPKMDGIQALEELRKLGCTQPIYALTANAMAHEISQYLALGFAGHLKKPIEREIFITTIVQHCIEISSNETTKRRTKNIEINTTEKDRGSLGKNIKPNNDGKVLIKTNVKFHHSQAQLADELDIADLVHSFVEHLSQDKDDLIRYSQNNDYDALSRTAHKILGAAQMFGFTEISQSAAELESSIKKQKTALVNDLTYCLLDEITLVQHNYQVD
jgi:CheY-like chemotaxis protein